MELLLDHATTPFPLLKPLCKGQKSIKSEMVRFSSGPGVLEARQFVLFSRVQVVRFVCRLGDSLHVHVSIRAQLAPCRQMYALEVIVMLVNDVGMSSLLFSHPLVPVLH